jgi:hypothetical protein
MYYVTMNKRFTTGVLAEISFAKGYRTEGLIPQRKVLLQKLAVPQTSKNSTSFKEPEVPLPPSQKPAFCPHPQPHKSAVHPSCFFKTIYEGLPKIFRTGDAIFTAVVVARRTGRW